MCKVLVNNTLNLTLQHSIVPTKSTVLCLRDRHRNIEHILKYLLNPAMADPHLNSDDSCHDSESIPSRNIWNHGRNNEWLSRITSSDNREDVSSADQKDIYELRPTSVVNNVVESILSSSPSPPQSNPIASYPLITDPPITDPPITDPPTSYPLTSYPLTPDVSPSISPSCEQASLSLSQSIPYESLLSCQDNIGTNALSSMRHEIF